MMNTMRQSSGIRSAAHGTNEKAEAEAKRLQKAWEDHPDHHLQGNGG